MSPDGPWAPPAPPSRTPEPSDPLAAYRYAPPGIPGSGSILPSAATYRRHRSWLPGWAVVTLLALLVGAGVVGVAVTRHGARSSAGLSVPLSLPPDLVPRKHHTPKHHPERTGGNAGGAVVTSQAAARVLADYWPRHERALVASDLTALAKLSTGPARRWEQAAVACGCLAVDSPRPLLDAAVFVPRQTTYPATFVAEGQTQYRGTYWTEVLVFTKARAGAAWLVEEDSGFGPPPGGTPGLFRPAVDARGFNEPVTARQHQRALRAAGDLARLWQQAKNTGAVPAGSGFALTGQTGERVAKLAAYPQDGVQENGLVGHFTFYTDRADPLVEVAEVGGYALACQPVRETVEYTPVGGQSAYQDPGRRNWGPHLAPGYYREVVSRDVWQTCFLVPPTPSEPISVLNEDVGGAVVTGVR